MSKPIDKTNILNYLKEHYSEFKNKYNVEKNWAVWKLCKR